MEWSPEVQSACIVHRDIGFDRWTLISGNLPSSAALSPASDGTATLIGNTLQVVNAKGVTTKITADDVGRIVSVEKVGRNRHSVTTLSGHVQVGDKWLPKDIVVLDESPSRTNSEHVVLSFTPGDLEDADLEISLPPDAGLVVFDTVDGKQVTTVITEPKSRQGSYGTPGGLSIERQGTRNLDHMDCFWCQDHVVPQYQAETCCDTECMHAA
jgi:hypothetical protein